MSWVQARLLAAVAATVLALPAHAALQVFTSANPVSPGDTFLLQWEESAADSAGYTDADFFFNWDPAVLDLTGAGAGTAFGTSTLTQYDPGFGAGWTWFNILRDTSVNVPTDGVLITLQFQVLAGATLGPTFVDIHTDPFGLGTAPSGYYIGSPSSLRAELDVTAAVTPIPEPATVALTLAGLGLVGLTARRRRG
ncbi:PEP-CTERM sorting domain-containing protein [Aquabacterium sp. J223]|uniref:PEP-CTERM sorting domain-containing protein n=1 Tax=Aquabacterium sp. J223 TaxID=2898431 RepID=UPI0021ADC377|nr:PEP-CTERM sorting domain-containing protein [Aquabacterium sp. J223]UUX95434.1 PEP-CTERM sorting domain-containing protein [Aquabacterium sp. J223]